MTCISYLLGTKRKFCEIRRRVKEHKNGVFFLTLKGLKSSFSFNPFRGEIKKEVQIFSSKVT